MSDRQLRLTLSYPDTAGQSVLKLLADGRGHTLDEIVGVTGLDWSAALLILTRLVLDDRVTCHPGFVYRQTGASYGHP